MDVYATWNHSIADVRNKLFLGTMGQKSISFWFCEVQLSRQYWFYHPWFWAFTSPNKNASVCQATADVIYQHRSLTIFLKCNEGDAIFECASVLRRLPVTWISNIILFLKTVHSVAWSFIYKLSDFLEFSKHIISWIKILQYEMKPSIVQNKFLSEKLMLIAYVIMGIIFQHKFSALKTLLTKIDVVIRIGDDSHISSIEPLSETG